MLHFKLMIDHKMSSVCTSYVTHSGKLQTKLTT